jgi:hypothetical protein
VAEVARRETVHFVITRNGAFYDLKSVAEVAGRAVVALRGNSDMFDSGEAKWFQLSNEDGAAEP